MTDEEHEAMLDGEIVMAVRDAAKDVTGGNCAFADDDVRLLAHLAHRAVAAGLVDRLHPQIQGRIAKAIEARRAETLGSVEDESAVAKGDLPKTSSRSGEKAS